MYIGFVCQSLVKGYDEKKGENGELDVSDAVANQVYLQ